LSTTPNSIFVIDNVTGSGSNSLVVLLGCRFEGADALGGTQMKARYLFLSLLAATALPIPAADASVLEIFGQTGTGDTVTGTRTGSSTTITSDTQVEITEIDADVVTPILATFTLNATNSGPATLSGGEILQRYAGSFTITNGATNYLSGTFSDAVFGAGGALTLSASNPSPTQSVTFTSNVIAPNLISAFNRALSLSFTDVSPNAAIVAGTLRSFNSDVSGSFSSAVPEPSTWAMMLLGFAGLGYVGFRKARARSAISIA
jgi:hypothetical protein